MHRTASGGDTTHEGDEGSVNFDRAAAFYDETRTDDPETIARQAEALRSEVAWLGRCLEIGAGTGRITLPLAASGVELVAVDISAAMVARLVAKAGDDLPLIALADATRLPFRERSFGSALASHVFHLIPEWRRAVDELVRVVRPGGKVLVSHQARAALMRQMRERFAEAVGLRQSFVGIQEIEELDREFESRGVEVRRLPPIEEHEQVLPETLIKRFEEGQLSQTWRIDEEARRHGAAELRKWAQATLGDRLQDVRRVISWHVYDLPGP
jgi:ubiquinone/menaquinone biosynthesis C-methylase UbiE